VEGIVTVTAVQWNQENISGEKNYWGRCLYYKRAKRTSAIEKSSSSIQCWLEFRFSAELIKYKNKEKARVSLGKRQTIQPLTNKKVVAKKNEQTPSARFCQHNRARDAGMKCRAEECGVDRRRVEKMRP